MHTSPGPSLPEMLTAAGRHAASFTPATCDHARVAVVACMDRRLDLMSLFGLEAGQAYIIRNAGGLVTDDVRRSLAIAQWLLGVEEIVLVRHTGCGMLGLADDVLLDGLEQETGARPTWRPGGFPDLEAQLGSCLRTLAQDPHIPAGAAARGFVYDLATGQLHEVHR